MTQFDMGFDYNDWDTSELEDYAITLASDIKRGHNAFRPTLAKISALIAERRQREEKC